MEITIDLTTLGYERVITLRNYLHDLGLQQQAREVQEYIDDNY